MIGSRDSPHFATALGSSLHEHQVEQYSLEQYSQYSLDCSTEQYSLDQSEQYRGRSRAGLEISMTSG